MSTLIDDLYVSMMSKCPVLIAPTDWKETAESHKFIVDLPGLKKEEVNVQVVDGERVIEISGERKTDKDEDHDKWHRTERCRGQFLRRFRLPENAKTDQVEASMENGVLVVTVPKLEIMKPEKKVIQIEGK